MSQMAPRLGLEEEDIPRAHHRWPAQLEGSPPAASPARTREQSWLSCASTPSFLLARRCQDGVFAAKVHFRDFRRTLDNSIGDALLENSLFIQLYREDILKQAVSEHFGQLTGRWGIDDSVTTPPAANPNFFDPDAVDRALNDLADQDRGWRVFFARRGVEFRCRSLMNGWWRSRPLFSTRSPAALASTRARCAAATARPRPMRSAIRLFRARTKWPVTT